MVPMSILRGPRGSPVDPYGSGGRYAGDLNMHISMHGLDGHGRPQPGATPFHGVADGHDEVRACARTRLCVRVCQRRRGRGVG